MSGKKRTKEQVEQEIFHRHNEHFAIIGEYKGLRHKTTIKHLHNNCNHTWEALPQNLIRGISYCPKCSNEKQRKQKAFTIETFKEQVKNKWGEEYSVVGDVYTNALTKIPIRHNTCGNIWNTSPNKLLRGKGCPFCNGGIRFTHETFIKQISDLVGDEYEILGIYENANKGVKIRHNVCGHEYSVKPSNFIHNNRRCPQCNLGEQRTIESYKDEVLKLSNGEYQVLGDFVNVETHVLMRHNECGAEFYMRPTNFIHNNNRCPQCFGNIKKTTKIFCNEVKEKTNGEYEVLGEYVNTHTKIKIKHNICGNEWVVEPNAFLRGNRCPRCSDIISKPEKQILNMLEDMRVNYIFQYRLDECFHLLKLPFDFAIFDEQNQLKGLIEYDGEYHYMPIISERQLQKQKLRDSIKTSFCSDNNIPLKRIPYWEQESIEEILINTISEFLV